jgi:hypothetical protein
VPHPEVPADMFVATKVSDENLDKWRAAFGGWISSCRLSGKRAEAERPSAMKAQLTRKANL